MKKTKIRNRLLLFVLVLALFVPSANGYASTQKQKALDAYKSMLSKSKVSILNSGSKYFDRKKNGLVTYSPTTSSKVQFAIAYIDNNDVPELIVKRSDGLFAVFTYKNSKIYRVKAGDTCDRFAGYYKKTGGYKLIDSSESYYDDKIQYEDYYLLTSSGSTKKLSKYVTPDEIEYRSVNKSNIITISHASFKSKFVSLTKGKALTKVKYYSNTAANRKKYLK